MTISEEQFDEVYKPQQNHLDDNASFDGCMYETYEEELDYVFELSKKENRVWTIIEGDSGGLFYSAGFHIVNRLGFLVTEKAWETGEEEVELEDLTEDTTTSDSIDTVHNALTQFVEDCAGEDSDEAEDAEGAWRHITQVFNLEQSEKEDLQTVLNSLDPDSNLHNTLSKVMKLIL